ncbi:unnamed protein product [Alternaria burnsii]|nr:unnamed protein product [Alternaria burnsii]
MVEQNEVSDERMPVQVTAQVALTSSDQSVPHPNSSSQSQSTAGSQSLIPTVVPVSMSQPDSDSCLKSSAVDIDFLQGAEPHIWSKRLASPPVQSDPTMDLQLLGDTHKRSRSQEEKHTRCTMPITPSFLDDFSNEVSTTPPLLEQIATPRSSPDGFVGPPTPSTVAPSSDRTPSALQIFESRSNQARQEHLRRTKIFHKTRRSMMCQTYRMLVFASRGFERGSLPTRQTKPPLLKRRHSIDVNTIKNWETREFACWLHFHMKQDRLRLQTSETEIPYVALSQHSLPDPRRYAAFVPMFYTEIPHNTENFLELGDVTLQNDAFHYIGATCYALSGMEVWMRGESLDMALEVLRRDEDCDTYGIDIANSTVAQICCFASSGIDGPSGEYDQYRARYNNKNWIIVVCNDGMGGIENDGTSGSHWSMVAMDRISKIAYYYDSLWVDRHEYQNLGRNISLGMLNILGEDISLWKYLIQLESPDQNFDNLFKQDGGACGPFVYKMTQILIRYIKSQQSLGVERLSLAVNYAWVTQVFSPQFHSGVVRREMQDSIFRWHRINRAAAIADRHDYQAIQDTDAVLDDGPVVSFEIPPKPRLPVLRRTRHTNKLSRSHHIRRGCFSGTNYHDPVDLDDSDENWTMGNSSDNSTAGSSSGGTVITGHEVLWEDAGVDTAMDDEKLFPVLDSGIQHIEATDDVQDEHTPVRLHRVVSPTEPVDAKDIV